MDDACSIAVADIGGTNARFAQADLSQNGTVQLHEPVVLPTADYPDLPSAWAEFLKRSGDFAPEGAALALAGPVGSERFKLTNAAWEFDTANLAAELGLGQVAVLNDFAAIAHALAGDEDAAQLAHLAGPDEALPEDGTVTVIGPGTGLGIAHYRKVDGRALIQPTEGSHIDFAPVDAIDDAVLAALRCEFERVSLERVVSGEGIAAIHTAILALEGGTADPREPLEIWQAGLAETDPTAHRAIAHFVTTLGRVAGDYALAHGASAVVLAGGLGLRLKDHLMRPQFHQAFLNKGRYRAMMEKMPIKLITHPQPGLLGAALAYLQRHRK